MTNFAKSPDIVLSCDGPSCMALPSKAPRVYVPPIDAAGANQGLPPVTLAFPHLHYCDSCWDTVMKLDDLLTDAVKARIEQRGAKIWPQGVKPDFDAALVQPIDVFSPEYGQYMKRIGLDVSGLGYEAHRLVKGLMVG